MRSASSMVALGACAVLLVVLGLRHGYDAFLAGLGLALAGGLVAVDLPGQRHSRPDGDDGGVR